MREFAETEVLPIVNPYWERGSSVRAGNQARCAEHCRRHHGGLLHADVGRRLGAEALAERARIELRATGGQACETQTRGYRHPHRAISADCPSGWPGGLQTRRSPRSCSSAARPSPATCGRYSPSSASPPATSSHASFPRGQAPLRRPRHRAEPCTLRLHQGDGGYPTDYPLDGHDYPRRRMRTQMHRA